jgi:hypothetical protein
MSGSISSYTSKLKIIYISPDNENNFKYVVMPFVPNTLEHVPQTP